MYGLRTVSPGFSPISRAVTQPQRAIHSVIAENMGYPVVSSIALMARTEGSLPIRQAMRHLMSMIFAKRRVTMNEDWTCQGQESRLIRST